MHDKNLRIAESPETPASSVLKQFSPERVLLPVLFGLGFVFFTVYHELTKNGQTLGDLLGRMTG